MIPAESPPTPAVEEPTPLGLRYLIVLAMFVACCAFLLILSLRGEARAVVIEGPSMAPYLQGIHWQITCDNCRFRWDREASIEASALGVICPNCAQRLKNPRQVFVAEDRVTIDKRQSPKHEPQRWDVVAIHRGNDWMVKRIVGLPGEEIVIAEGDVIVNGKRCPWDLSTWRQTAVLVHDDQFRSQRADSHPRWESLDEKSSWETLAAGYRLQAKQPDALVELQYAHERYVFGSPPGPQRLPILDEDHYNIGPPRELNAVHDIGLRFTCDPSHCDELRLLLFDGINWNTAVWSRASADWQIHRADQALIVGKEIGGLPNPSELEFVLRDGQLLLAVNDETVLSVATPRENQSDRLPSASSVRLAARGTLTVHSMQVLRDIVYLTPQHTTGRWRAPRRLAEDEYFVLGDNSSVSIDSRTWTDFAVRREEIVGVVRK